MYVPLFQYAFRMWSDKLVIYDCNTNRVVVILLGCETPHAVGFFLLDRECIVDYHLGNMDHILLVPLRYLCTYIPLSPRTWNKTQQSRVCAMKINYLRGACGMTRWQGENNGKFWIVSRTNTKLTYHVEDSVIVP